MKALLLAIIVYVSLINSSWAYLNPGTSSLILQGVAASFAVAMGFVTLGWQRIKLFFGNLFGKTFRKKADPPPEDEPAP